MPRPFLRELLCSSTKALLPLQFPFRLLYKVFVSACLFSSRALFLRSPFRLGTLGRFPCSSPPPRRGSVLYVYLLAPYVLLDYLLVLDNVLANSQLFLDYGPLLDDNLVLGHRHSNLVLADLCLRSLSALDRHPLYADLFVSGGYPYLLAVGPDILADPHLTGFALSGASPKLFFGPLYPKLLLVTEVLSTVKVISAVCRPRFVTRHVCLLASLRERLPRACSLELLTITSCTLGATNTKHTRLHLPIGCNGDGGYSLTCV